MFEEDKSYEKFVKTAIILTLTVGVTFGAVVLSYIAIKQNFNSIYYALIQAHGHAQIYGWVGLCIMGFAPIHCSEGKEYRAQTQGFGKRLLWICYYRHFTEDCCTTLTL